MRLENKFSPIFFLPPPRDPYDEWRPVEDPAIREWAYYVNTYGDVFAGKYGHLLKWQTNHGGYQFVCMDGKEQYTCPSNKGARYQRKVHRLVMIAFNPVPGYEKLQVNHKDGNKLNNHISNLEWCTAKENTDHAIKTNLRTFKMNGNITPDIARTIKALLAQGYTHKKVLELVNYCCTIDVIDNIATGKSWWYV